MARPFSALHIFRIFREAAQEECAAGLRAEADRRNAPDVARSLDSRAKRWVASVEAENILKPGFLGSRRNLSVVSFFRGASYGRPDSHHVELRMGRFIPAVFAEAVITDRIAVKALSGGHDDKEPPANEFSMTAVADAEAHFLKTAAAWLIRNGCVRADIIEQLLAPKL